MVKFDHKNSISKVFHGRALPSKPQIQPLKHKRRNREEGDYIQGTRGGGGETVATKGGGAA